MDKTKFDHIVDFYKSDISSVRTGRATPALVEDVAVDAYGQKMTIKELASISTPEPRTVVIQPWDKGVLENIVSGIQKSSVGLAPIVDGDLIRLSVPALTEERRKEFIKIVKQKTEEAKIKIRRVREELHKSFDDMSKDEAFRAKEDLQKIVDEYNHKLEELEKKKEWELMQ
ncbi:MAG: ribosome recycling factor [Patescibacteria group bacterium]